MKDWKQKIHACLYLRAGGKLWKLKCDAAYGKGPHSRFGVTQTTTISKNSYYNDI